LNNITGIVASAILLLGYRLNDGDIAKYFGAAVGFAIAMSLVNYLAIFPAFWMLREKFPDTNRPYRVPAHRTVSIWLTFVVAFGIVQLLAPGFGRRNLAIIPVDAEETEVTQSQVPEQEPASDN
jgi:amino acid transporter